MMIKVKGFVASSMLGGAILAAGPLVSQAEGAAAPSAPTLGDVFTASGITFSGYLDAGYNHMSTNGTFTSGVPSRVFDTELNSFSVDQLGLTMSKLPAEGFGGLVNLTLGDDAKVMHSVGGSTDDNLDLTQAYIQYSTGALTVMGGKFVTLAGAEVIATPSNSNSSRSFLFGYAVPFTHTGLRGSYKINDMISLTVGANNGWDQQKDTNPKKTLELGATFTPIKTVTVVVDGYTGKEKDPIGGQDGTRDLIDVVATFAATDELSLGLNYDNGRQKNPFSTGGNAKWDGVAGYLNYKFTDQWKTSLRLEQFNDKDGFRTGVVQKLKSATLDVVYSPASNFDLIGEIRGDKSNHSAFVDDSGSSTSSKQNSVNLRGILKF